MFKKRHLVCDFFASNEALMGDTVVDAMIVIGINTIVVSLGLGIPWTAANLYHTAHESKQY